MIDIEKVKIALEKLKTSTIYGLGHFLHSATEEENKILDQAINELERLQNFKKTFNEYELAQNQGFIAFENWQECEKELKKLQERETPMKPKIVTMVIVGRELKLYHCPKCDNDEVDVYCNKCGQKLDWSEEDETRNP